MRVGDFTLIALDTLAILSFFGAWLWTRGDRKKSAADQAKPKP
jgi:hypothetical protein